MELGKIQKALIIAPHGDDEVLGAGGFISKLIESGSRVTVIFLSIDASNHYGYQGETQLQDRKQEIVNAAKFLGFDFEIVYEGQGLIEKLDTLPQRTLVDLFENKINTYQPDILLLPAGDDYDQDHEACYKAGLAATRPIPMNLGKYFVPKIVEYEMPKLVWSQRPFKPDIYIDISQHIDKKLEAITKYYTQLREPPHIRSLDNIRYHAKLRGAEAGCDCAEAYSVLRWIL